MSNSPRRERRSFELSAQFASFFIAGYVRKILTGWRFLQMVDVLHGHVSLPLRAGEPARTGAVDPQSGGMPNERGAGTASVSAWHLEGHSRSFDRDGSRDAGDDSATL